VDEAAVQALLDERAIHRVLVRYCRGVDRADEALLRDAYHEDARDQRGWFDGTGWEFARVITGDFRRHGRASLHLLTNATIEVTGDEARSESYTLALSTAPDGTGPVQAFAGRYLDRFARRDGEWRIAHRTVVRDWHADLERVEGAPFLRDLGDQLRGAFAPDDASCALFATGGAPS
jgi:hypothetical protein